MKTLFTGKMTVLGCGGVAQCVLPLILKHFDILPSNITVVDFIDNRERISHLLKQGINYLQHKITPDNLDASLTKLASTGDLIIDLAWNIDCIEIIDWCHQHGVLYINTSVEEWDPYTNNHLNTPTTRTLYHRHMRLRRHIQSWQKSKAATAVLDHGANPGLVSHFVKQALQDISLAILEKGVEPTRQHALEKALGDAAFPQMACLTGTKVIHISERDSQIINRPKEVGEFVNTWSIEGLYEESIAPAELGWGTHEKTLPSNAHLHEVGPGHQICLEQMGMHTKIRSWVPSGEIIGMLIRHGEAFTISEHLSLNEPNGFSYRPTVHYAYCPSDATLASLHELTMQNYAHPTRQRVVSDEIISGVDELGVLLMGHDFNSWWTGSSLDIDTARTLVPGQNATTLQVAASVISAIEWMLRNPDAGVKVPDELPYQEILSTARPYLGDVLSIPNEWTPLQSPWHAMANPYGIKLDKSDPWQFHNFLAS